ncbi:5-oxoprolinase subunit C family protein [Gracilimonas halophila]|uniref:Biotin-dependent carboxyltransferase family protein n=1 Tax=Gracilimonas halophila TaxID=1834464 RepID=A0ABW5JNQ5_9BACT
MKGELEVLDAGFMTTVQDHGRYGYRKYGVPVSGVMDEHSYRLANWLVGNTPNTPVLELTLTGGVFKFHSDAIVGISGGEAELAVDEKPIVSNKTIRITKGETLKIARVTAGCRVYLAIAGDWDIEQVMGSYSTCLAANFGGFKGRPMKKGDRITWQCDMEKKVERMVPKKLLPHFSTRQTIRIIEGVEWDLLNEKQKVFFLETDFRISSQSNRMGIRLEGRLMRCINDQEMVSSPVIPGIIQLPSSGLPIILMKDAQSVGGYPRTAKVIDADLWRLGQVWRGTEISFSLIDRREALELFDYYRSLRESLLT